MIIKKMLILISAGLAVLLLISACTQKSNTINTAGSTTALPIVQAAAEAFMDKNPGINISVRGGGSSIGIKSAINQSIDIGNASRKITKNETDLIDEKQANLIETAIAKDAISIVVHKDNPVTNLTLQQLKEIFSGKIQNWKEVSGFDKEIIVIFRDVSSGSFMVFNEVVLDNSKVKENSMRLASNNAVATAVSYTPGAIGYIGLGYVNENIKLLSIDAVFPSSKTAQNDQYKLTRLLYMYTSETPRKPAQDFIYFIISDEGQEIVEAQGYVRIMQ
ncbi:MAG: PstS family phosphate ABC transporter substrate-binding protein [Candidatus Cloacimonadales bacterium]|nr:PstS family phosphate ABC transporter substrate-binding protein [Candidatus Cloacimonadales bacterium]